MRDFRGLMLSLIVTCLIDTDVMGLEDKSPPPPRPYQATVDAPPAGKLARVKLAMLYKLSIYARNQHRAYPGNVVIGVYGKQIFGRDLAAINRGLPDNQQCIPVAFANPGALGPCDVLFVAAGTAEQEMEAIRKHYAGRSLLIVTDEPAGIPEGAVVNFRVVKGIVKMELDREEMNKRRIAINPRLRGIML